MFRNDTAFPLDSNGYSLKQIVCLIEVTGDRCDSLANLLHNLDGFVIPYPDVSIAIGTNRFVVVMDMYLVVSKVAG